MGNCFTGVFRRRNVRRHIVLILIGLDNAGKTKTVNNLAGEVDDKVLPTVGFKAVNLIHKDTPVTIYDLGGGPNFRQIWPQYYSEVHGIIFVIDSSDFSRLDECKIVLEEVLSHDKISGKPVLVLANKQDKTGALDDIDVVEKLNIEPLVNKYRCPTLVESYTNNIENKGKKPKIDPDLKKGYLWLLNYIVSRYGDINLRVQTDMHADLERRKRLMNKSTASQTVSEDIVGFENPNYTIEKSEKSENTEKCEEGVIVVKPIKNKVNSVDTTITIESVDESGNTSARPKLSPLFGRTSDNSLTEARIELEPRSEYRKLSPIVKVKSGVNHIDLQHRPQSSPTSRVKSGSQSKESSVVVMSDVRSRTWDVSERHNVLVADKEIALTDREWERSGAHSDSHFGPNGGATVASEGPRPASASALVRRQLELLPAQHKRRLSLRYMHRNRTSPERSTMLIYEPKSAQRQLDQGDFENANRLY